MKIDIKPRIPIIEGKSERVKGLSLWSSITINMRMRVIETISGAITGPVHGAGIKNRISHSRKEDGQLRNIFSQM